MDVWTLLITLLILLVIGALLAGSLATWVAAGVRWSAGRPALPHREREPPRYNPLLLTVLLLFVAFHVANWVWGMLHPVERELAPRMVMLQAGINALQVVIMLGLLAPTPQYRLADFGIELRGGLRQTAEGLLGLLASLVPVYAVMLVVLVVVPREVAQHDFLRMLQEHPEPATIFWIILAAVIIGPLAEELVFRVALQGWLQTWLPPSAAIGGTAVLFAVVHGWPAMVGLLPLSIVIGYVYYRRHSLLAVYVLHAGFNGLNVLLALAGQMLGEP